LTFCASKVLTFQSTVVVLGFLAAPQPSQMQASRVAVIFNASSPLAKALALDFAQKGFSLALCDPDPTQLDGLVEECFRTVVYSPFLVSTFQLVLTDRASVVRQSAQEICQEFDRIDVLCFVEPRGPKAKPHLILDEQEDEEEDDDEDQVEEDGFKPPLIPLEIPTPPLDFHWMLNAFYRKLMEKKPPARPLKVYSGKTSKIYLEDVETTPLLLYVYTPEALKNKNFEQCSRERHICTVVEAMRGCTALVGTLENEHPFWKQYKEEAVITIQHIPSPKSASSSFKRFNSRYRAFDESLLLTESDTIPSKQMHEFHEYLTCKEASEWVLYGLEHGKRRILVGYDVCLYEFAQAVGYTALGKNLLPLRLPTSNHWDVLTPVIYVVLCFSILNLFMACIVLIGSLLWHGGKHYPDVKERGMSALLYILSWQRNPTFVTYLDLGKRTMGWKGKEVLVIHRRIGEEE
jgi:hypothetical protein